jgi:uroporphyrinogen decarboxylase
VAEAQVRLRERYRHDCLYLFFFAALEHEAWGGEVLYIENGPPNAGAPLVRHLDDILRLTPPRVAECPGLQRVLRATELAKARIGDEAPIIGVVMSPFSLPVMQVGFESYIQVLFERPDLFAHLMRVNETFCAEWANAQLAAGATAICYFDPLSSPSMVSCADFLSKGAEVGRRMRAAIRGPMAIHLASGRSQAILQPIADLGFAAVGVSVDEDLAGLKHACGGRIALLGNLNGIAMRRWTPEQAETAVRECLKKAGPGGGYILSDTHGEIPCQVPDDVLLAVSDTVHRWGRYPLAWATGHGA